MDAEQAPSDIEPMAVLDQNLMLAETAYLTGSAGTRAIGVAVDLGAQPGRMSDGLRWTVRVKSMREAGGGNCMGSGRVRFHLVSDATPAIATNGSATLHAISPWLDGCAWDDEGNLSGDLLAGVTAVSMPLPGGTYEPYLGLLVETSALGMASGAIQSFLS